MPSSNQEQSQTNCMPLHAWQIDYAANTKMNGKRRQLLLEGGSRTLDSYPVVVEVLM